MDTGPACPENALDSECSKAITHLSQFGEPLGVFLSCRFATFRKDSLFFSIQVTMHATCMTLTAMTIDRYYAIVHPVSSHRRRTPKEALIVSAVIWLGKSMRNSKCQHELSLPFKSNWTFRHQCLSVSVHAKLKLTVVKNSALSDASEPQKGNPVLNDEFQLTLSFSFLPNLHSCRDIPRTDPSGRIV